MKINSLIKITLSNILIVGLIGCGEVNQEDIQDNTSLVNQEDAQDNNSHVNQEDINQSTSPFFKVKEVYDGETLGAGTFYGYDVNYYKLEMPKAGNLLVDSMTPVYLYDKDLEPISSSSISTNGNLNLEKGSYIIKVKHYSSGSKFTINSNVLFEQNKLPLIEKGTYFNKGVQFYLFKMPKAGNLVVDSMTPVYLYDIDLKPISSSSIYGNLNLEKGSYIIKIKHYSRGSKFTLNSNVFN